MRRDLAMRSILTGLSGVVRRRLIVVFWGLSCLSAAMGSEPVKSSDKAIPSTMVMEEMSQRRPTYLLRRGQYDQRGEQASSRVPQVLASDEEARLLEKVGGLTRLDLSRWLTSPDQPLTARVAVNRWWEMLFGTGLVETSEDFGVQRSHHEVKS
jgi:hypothetical protein